MNLINIHVAPVFICIPLTYKSKEIIKDELVMYSITICMYVNNVWISDV